MPSSKDFGLPPTARKAHSRDTIAMPGAFRSEQITGFGSSHAGADKNFNDPKGKLDTPPVVVTARDRAETLWYELKEKYDDVPDPEKYTYGTNDSAWYEALRDFKAEMEEIDANSNR